MSMIWHCYKLDRINITSSNMCCDWTCETPVSYSFYFNMHTLPRDLFLLLVSTNNNCAYSTPTHYTQLTTLIECNKILVARFKSIYIVRISIYSKYNNSVQELKLSWEWECRGIIFWWPKVVWFVISFPPFE